MNKYFLGEDAARFSVVSFAENATTRVPWSYDAAVINAGIDSMTADGSTSVSDGFEAAEQLFVSGRESATKIVLFLSDGEQSTQFAAPGKTATKTAIDAAALVKGSGVTVFAWGFGNKVSNTTLMQIATDSSKALLVQSINELEKYLEGLEATVCNESPPLCRLRRPRRRRRPRHRRRRRPHRRRRHPRQARRRRALRRRRRRRRHRPHPRRRRPRRRHHRRLHGT